MLVRIGYQQKLYVMVGRILKKLDEMGYRGYYGLEYYPLKEVVPSLQETIEYLTDVASF